MRGHIRFMLSIVVTILVLGASFSWAESGGVILLLEERDQDGGIHQLENVPAIADINSSVRVGIRQDVLRRQVTSLGPTKAMAELFEKSTSLRKSAIAGQQSLSGMQSALAEWSRSTKDKVAVLRLQAALNSAAAPALDIFMLAPRGSSLRAVFNKALPQTRGLPMFDQYRVVFEVAAKEADRLTTELMELAKIEGSYVQLGAWIRTSKGDRPIHLSGFDEYPLGERFDVPRFNFALSEEQKKQMEINAKQAKEIEQKGLGEWLSENMRTFLESGTETIPSLVDNQVLPCISDLRKALEGVRVAVGVDWAKIKPTMDTTNEKLNGYEIYLRTIQEKYKSGGSAYTMPSAALLESINSDAIELCKRTNEIDAEMTGAFDDINKALGASETARAAKEVQRSVLICLEKLKEVSGGFDSLRTVSSMLMSGRRTDASLMEFGKEVLKLDINSLPGTTEFSLLDTGVREPGDSVVVKLAAGSTAVPRRELEVREFLLFKTLPRVDTAVGLIFSRNGDKFQPAPSFSWLLKCGSRSSVMYNRLWDIGIGINVAALDFNKDDTSEIGAGITLSLIRDYVQFGYGFNINQSKGYPFFGLAFPLPTK